MLSTRCYSRVCVCFTSWPRPGLVVRPHVRPMQYLSQLRSALTGLVHTRQQRCGCCGAVTTLLLRMYIVLFRVCGELSLAQSSGHDQRVSVSLCSIGQSLWQLRPTGKPKPVGFSLMQRGSSCKNNTSTKTKTMPIILCCSKTTAVDDDDISVDI